MTDSQNEDIYLLEYPPTVNELHHWKGSGVLRWRNSDWKGNFALLRLLNGRLRFIFKLHNWRENSDKFAKHYPLEFEGTAEDGSLITVDGIHFTRRLENEHGNGLDWICVGYASTAKRRVEAESDTISIRCDLSNYSLNQRLGNVALYLDGFDITIERLSWGNIDNGIAEHAIAYQHASISTCLKIENIAPEQTNGAVDCLQEVAAILSIASRGFVHIVARHIWNSEKGKIDSIFEEPPFPKKGWVRPLIPSHNIENFLLAAYSAGKNGGWKRELGHISDHYLQALTLRSAWPTAVGVFTAMETLKSIFFALDKGAENAIYQWWVVPPEDFESNENMVKEIVDVLCKHFPRFEQLDRNQKSSLRDQIRHGLKRRSYKTQLKHMLNTLDIDHSSQELRAFINIRNELIHTGKPQQRDSKSAWRQAKRAVGLFERTLLAFLHYNGPSELFDFDEEV